MTEAVTEDTEKRKPRTPREFVVQRVSRWQALYLQRRPEALAALARLRRGAGKEPGALPELWQYTFEDLPAPPTTQDAPTRDERAVHTALTLFALHQQSRAEEMHRPGQRFGTAIRQLRRHSASEEAVRRRFEALGTAETFTEVAYHARGLITQLRTHKIPFDYGDFTESLIWLQTRAAQQVRLQWARDFYRTDPKTDDPNDSTSEDT